MFSSPTTEQRPANSTKKEDQGPRNQNVYGSVAMQQRRVEENYGRGKLLQLPWITHFLEHHRFAVHCQASCPRGRL